MTASSSAAATGDNANAPAAETALGAVRSADVPLVVRAASAALNVALGGGTRGEAAVADVVEAAARVVRAQREDDAAREKSDADAFARRLRAERDERIARRDADARARRAAEEERTRVLDATLAALVSERDALALERNALATERVKLTAELEALAAIRTALSADREEAARARGAFDNARETVTAELALLAALRADLVKERDARAEQRAAAVQAQERLSTQLQAVGDAERARREAGAARDAEQAELAGERRRLTEECARMADERRALAEERRAHQMEVARLDMYAREPMTPRSRAPRPPVRVSMGASVGPRQPSSRGTPRRHAESERSLVPVSNPDPPPEEVTVTVTSPGSSRARTPLTTPRNTRVPPQTPQSSDRRASSPSASVVGATAGALVVRTPRRLSHELQRLQMSLATASWVDERSPSDRWRVQTTPRRLTGRSRRSSSPQSTHAAGSGAGDSAATAPADSEAASGELTVGFPLKRRRDSVAGAVSNKANSKRDGSKSSSKKKRKKSKKTEISSATKTTRD